MSELIKELAYISAQEIFPKAKLTNGFTKWCKDYSKKLLGYCLSMNIHPDLWYVESDTLYLIEIEDTSLLTDRKLRKIYAWWETLDAIEAICDIEVWVLNRYGKNPTKVFSFTEDTWYDVVDKIFKNQVERIKPSPPFSHRETVETSCISH